MKQAFGCMVALVVSVLTVSACSTRGANDPAFLALKANPPRSIPARDLVYVRRGQTSCTTYNEGTREAYQLCWFAYGSSSGTAALYYYSPPIRGAIQQNNNFITSIQY